MVLAGGGFGTAYWKLENIHLKNLPKPVEPVFPRPLNRHFGAKPKYDPSWRGLQSIMQAQHRPFPPLTASTLDLYKDLRFNYLPDLAQTNEAWFKAPGTQAVGTVSSAVRKRPEEPVAPTDHLVLFSLFINDGTVAPDVRYFIEQLRAQSNGVYGVIAVDTTNKSHNDAIENLKLDPELLKLFRGLLVRVNHGLDFSAFSHLLREFPDLWDAEQLTFTNDSIFGPLSPQRLKGVFERTQSCKSDFVGLTESMEGIEKATQWHYQSFFYTLKSAALRHPGVQQFWLDDMYSLEDKTEIIRQFELGLAQRMRDLGVPTEALFSLFDLDPHANPSVEFADVLIERGYPFLKKSLFRVGALAEMLDKVDLLPLQRQFPFNLTGHVGQGHIPPLPLNGASLLSDEQSISSVSCVQNKSLPSCPSLRIPTMASSNGLAICAMVNSVDNPSRWLNHHRQLGVERFYLYQYATSSFLSETAPEIFSAGDVRWEYANNAYGRSPRAAVYTDCLEKFAAHHSWMAFTPENSYYVLPSRQTSLPELLKKFNAYGALAVHQRQMGDLVPLALAKAGGQEAPRHCAGDDEPDCENVHLIGNTKFLQSTADGQKGNFTGGAFAVNELGQRVNGTSSPHVSMQNLELQRFPLGTQNVAEKLGGAAELPAKVKELDVMVKHSCIDGRLPLQA